MRPAESLPHICFLAPNAFPVLAEDAGIDFAGGAELQQVIIAKGLARRGYPVSMICLDFGQDDLVEIDGITVHRAFRPDEGIPVLRFAWPRLTRYWECLKQVDADIYYQRTASMLTGVLATFGRRHAKRTIHAVAGAAKIRFSRDRWLYRHGTRHVDRIVVQNEMQARAIREATGRDSILIPNAYDGEISPIRGGRYILWVGMIREVKRPDILLDLAEALPELQFVMVGGASDGQQALYERISQRAARLQNVDFAGFVPYAKVGSYFDEAMLFLNTSESEGFPNTFLQSWARGIPTVSFVDSGARLDGAPLGRIVQSIEEMTTTVSSLVRNDSERAALAEQCMHYVERVHGPDRVLELYEELFHSMSEQ